MYHSSVVSYKKTIVLHFHWRYMLSPSIRDAIYSIYGFVRFADEIVDSFHGFNKED
jgi:phytoene/squalene synthetase